VRRRTPRKLGYRSSRTTLRPSSLVILDVVKGLEELADEQSSVFPKTNSPKHRNRR
jgi:hypothetical protein